MIVWLDLETTGLNPYEDSILEVAIAVQGDPYATPTPGSHVLYYGGTPDDAYVEEMHTKNGLLSECREVIPQGTYSQHPLVEEWILSQLPGEDGSYTLAGSSVHFDLEFLRRRMPAVADKFSHRLLDVSAIKLFCQSLGMPKLPKGEAHRAAADILESAAHLRACRDWIKAGVVPTS